ncbi:CBS domain-containing protein [Bosea sp. LjRoot90]|uniref:CBS domain-containing protein n=1 Tax=Bosea sp. LjRoot90 TaxID=3342342 RepID=UPI003ECDD1E6
MSWALAVICLVLIGLLLVFFAKKLNLELGDAAKSVLVVLPVAGFLFASGRVAQFEALGIKATLAQIAKQPVARAQAAAVAIEQQDATSPNFEFDAMWLNCRPYYVMSDRTAYSGDKVDAAKVYKIARSIYSSIICGEFKALIVLGKDDKPIGYFERDIFLQLMRLRLIVYNGSLPSDEEITRDLNESELGVILANPVVRAKAQGRKLLIPADTDLEEALKKFQETGFQIAVLLDRRGRFDGIVTRQIVAEKLLLDLFVELRR